ncbi:MAG: hypothetical protein JRG71_12030 [Deltaproteobacteria bacterium]|nr:hypothetical protein [Deltaproteobacteria bacterium]
MGTMENPKGHPLCCFVDESDSGYLLLAPAQTDTLLEFGFDIIEALMESLNIHPEIHDTPHD